ncbi:MAG: hypothetical protein ABR507_12345 [Actinomycetota bacterium]
MSTDEKIVEAAGSISPHIYEVELSSDMSATLTAMDRRSLDAAVLDLSDGGFSTAKELRLRPDGDRVGLVLICERTQDRWVCLQAGADEVILKPLADPSALTSIIQSAINSRRNVAKKV